MPVEDLCGDMLSFPHSVAVPTKGDSSLTDTIWFNTEVHQSSQWAELRAVWLIAANGAPPLTICTDGQAVHRGMTLWISTQHANKWMVIQRPSWGQTSWQDLWELRHQEANHCISSDWACTPCFPIGMMRLTP